MTRRPDLARACHQLERHTSGTPNDPPPAPSWAQNLAAFNTANREISTKLLAGLDTWSAGMRSKQEAS